MIGPNCDGMVAFHGGGALWGDALVARPAGASRARVPEWQHRGQRAGRGPRDRLPYGGNLGRQPGRDQRDRRACRAGRGRRGRLGRAVPGGRRRRRAPCRRARAGGGARGRRGRAQGRRDDDGRGRRGSPHGLARRRPPRLPRARRGGGRGVGRRRPRPAGAGEGAGGARRAPARSARRRRRARAGGGLAILTCSGGDSGLAADEAGRRGLALPPLSAATAARLAPLLPRRRRSATRSTTRR